MDLIDSLKRKRSPSVGAGIGNANGLAPAPAAKAVKVGPGLSINYLARQSQEDLPLIHKDDTLPNLLELLAQYSHVLDRQESLASNLGARPLGPILIKRFERCFDAPPRIITSQSKGAAGGTPDDGPPQITWLEVIEFARAHPGQFTLSSFSEGSRICHFYYPHKQLHVQISEEDYLFIKSGRCQELIPPLPIWEDEEKEFNTCDLLEVRLKELTNAADLVAARTRQLAHRLSRRRAAIVERRAEGGSGTPARASAPQTTPAPTHHPGAGNLGGHAPGDTASASVREELLRHFESLPHNATGQHARQNSLSMSSKELTNGGTRDVVANGSPLATSSHPGDGLPHHEGTPSQKASQANLANSLRHNFSRPLPPALESSQPYRPLCQAHMDALPRGRRVLPPCDRCRRLHMDCVKNLTSCAGCTRKHARCHWREVTREEVDAIDHLMEMSESELDGASGRPVDAYMNGQPESDGAEHEDSEDDDSNPLEDLEALGHKEELEKTDTPVNATEPPSQTETSPAPFDPAPPTAEPPGRAQTIAQSSPSAGTKPRLIGHDTQSAQHRQGDAMVQSYASPAERAEHAPSSSGV